MLAEAEAELVKEAMRIDAHDVAGSQADLAGAALVRHRRRDRCRRRFLVADLAGALYWPEEGALIVSDLHLEKGSAFAVRGVLMPPYDTAATLEALAGVIARYAARIVIALGDSFPDGGGPPACRDRPRELRIAARSRLDMDCRNRDPIRRGHRRRVRPHAGARAAVVPPRADGVRRRRRVKSSSFSRSFNETFGETCGEIAGHLHPTARIHQRGRTQTRKCFATDGERLVMPAFGAFTGGLDIRNAAFLKVFGALGFTAHLIGQRRLYSFAAARCLSD